MSHIEVPSCHMWLVATMDSADTERTFPSPQKLVHSASREYTPSSWSKF